MGFRRTPKDPNKIPFFGIINGQTERLTQAFNGALTATVQIGTLVQWWSGDVGAAMTLAIVGWVAFGVEAVRTRIAVLVKTDRVLPDKVAIEAHADRVAKFVEQKIEESKEGK